MEYTHICERDATKYKFKSQNFPYFVSSLDFIQRELSYSLSVHQTELRKVNKIPWCGADQATAEMLIKFLYVQMSSGILSLSLSHTHTQHVYECLCLCMCYALQTLPSYLLSVKTFFFPFVFAIWFLIFVFMCRCIHGIIVSAYW